MHDDHPAGWTTVPLSRHLPSTCALIWYRCDLRGGAGLLGMDQDASRKMLNRSKPKTQNSSPNPDVVVVSMFLTSYIVYVEPAGKVQADKPVNPQHTGVYRG